MKIYEIFESISGEAGGYPQGTWASFIRLHGCNLRCDYCDTPHAQGPNAVPEELSMYSILEMDLNHHVLITGGEPLLQTETPELVEALQKAGHKVQIETNGSLKIPVIFNDNSAYWVMDRKGPSSKETDKMIPLEDLIENIRMVRRGGSHVLLKWVVDSQEDLEWMVKEMRVVKAAQQLTIPCIVSPMDANGKRVPEIIEAIKEAAGEDFRAWMRSTTISVQLHKICHMP